MRVQSLKLLSKADETILRRAQSYGINILRLAQIILWFAASLTVERVHPLQGGFFRLTNRHERRPELPIEPVWKFYPWLVPGFLIKHWRIAREAWRVFRIYRRVVADAHVAYVDKAMTPVTDEQAQTFELFTHNKSAREAVEHARKIKTLTGTAPAVAESAA